MLLESSVLVVGVDKGEWPGLLYQESIFAAMTRGNPPMHSLVY
jgi:hypothetical protein